MSQISSRAEAQQRVDRVSAFQQELFQLEKEQVLQLTPDTKQALKQYHQQLLAHLSQQFDVDINQPGKSLTRGMQVASFFGALALACSIFFLFYQYWGFLGTPLQVVILIAAPVLTLVATGFIRNKEQTGYFAKLMALISFACFILNIHMLGQIFNLTPSDNALLVWCLYAGVLAYALGSSVLLCIAICFFYGFIAARVGSWFGLYWLSMGDRPENFLIPALILFMVPSLISHRSWQCFASVYRVMGACGLLLAILVLSHWGRASYINASAGLVEGVYQVLGFVASAGFIYWGVRKTWSPIVNVGSVFFTIFLFTKFFDWWWEVMPKYLFFFIVGLTALLFLMVFNRLRESLKQKQEVAV